LCRRRWYIHRSASFAKNRRTTLIAIGLIYGASFVWHKASATKILVRLCHSTANDLTVNLVNARADFARRNEVMIEFRDS